jgi:hypothetical protein
MAETDAKVEPGATKEPYSTPELVRHGTVEELTRGAITIALPSDANSLIT